jgi:hypothetical protein
MRTASLLDCVRWGACATAFQALYACAPADLAARHIAPGSDDASPPMTTDDASIGGPKTDQAGPTGAEIPCDVKKVVEANCTSCHASPPKFGSPMSLVTWDDFQKPSVTNPSRKVYDLANERIHLTGTGRMPQDKQLSPADLATLEAWFGAGAPAGSSCDPPTLDAGAGVDASTADAPIVSREAGPDEQCFELLAHGQKMPNDQTPFSSSLAEVYTCFNFSVPWTKPMQGVEFHSIIDDVSVVHHWLLYQSAVPTFDGTFASCVGAHPGTALVTGWAPGGTDLVLPPDVGLELPAPGQSFQLEIHYNNPTAQAFQDRSGVRICATPTFRQHAASITWAGTESIQVPARAQGTAAGKCVPKRAGLGATDPIHVLYDWPHGHKLLTRMQTLINRANGTTETLHDGPFSFSNQTSYDTPTLILPGDSLSTTCWYNNTTDAAVHFGPSTTQEMCYAFIYAWPAHALDGGGGVTGATNTCIQ